MGRLGCGCWFRSRLIRRRVRCHFIFSRRWAGRDIDGNMALGSYQDYRFRAPNLLLLQQSFEHSIWGPFGFQFMTDEGRVATTRGIWDLAI